MSAFVSVAAISVIKLCVTRGMNSEHPALASTIKFAMSLPNLTPSKYLYDKENYETDW